MHWTMYEVFSVISGLILMAAAVVSDLFSGMGRAKVFLAGVAFAGYGIYVARQDSGTYEFPVGIFVIPILAVLYVIFLMAYRAYQDSATTNGRQADDD